ncbi:MAG: hypothetical protein M1823_004335 [Watsoniomyces obsoletus]|nr:MAG: hypothetical protein M1823_004335 [Watsoniomyces obsoletus]
MQNLFLSDPAPSGLELRKANAALRRALSSRRPLTSPVKRYVSRLADASEHLEAQLAISEKTTKDCQTVFDARRRQKSGKRLVIKDKIVVTTKEIREGVRAAEEETAAKKKKGKGKGKASDPIVVEDAAGSALSEDDIV